MMGRATGQRRAAETLGSIAGRRGATIEEAVFEALLVDWVNAKRSTIGEYASSVSEEEERFRAVEAKRDDWRKHFPEARTPVFEALLADWVNERRLSIGEYASSVSEEEERFKAVEAKRDDWRERFIDARS